MYALALTLALTLAGAAGLAPAAGEPMLSVPFLSQTEALCGGAAAAMVFRFWGDRHADVAQFEPLVDRTAGGIADSVLIDAIRQKGWEVSRLDGSIDVIREQLRNGRPAILLIEDRPSRYHYVVAVGADDTRVFLHDPTWGPSRAVSFSTLLRAWQPTNFWTLVVTRSKPIDGGETMRAPPPLSVAGRSATADLCDRLLDAALDEIAAQGPAAADAALGRVRTQCPGASAPLRELAGVRFSQQRWSEAAALASEAVTRDPTDRYAWDVLGSSRFVQNDGRGALHAWNHIKKPAVDSIQIHGLTRTRYTVAIDALDLRPNVLLTDSAFALAERRLQQLPDRRTSRLSYSLDADGFATVDVTIVERPRWPRGPFDWTAVAAPAIINRELTLVLPGYAGQGEVWMAGWRWWDQRPAVTFGFVAPRAGRLGLLRVDGLWEQQTYRTDLEERFHETRARGSVGISNWLAPNLRYELTAGLDVWNHTQRAGSIGGAVDRRLFDDRVSLTGEATHWMGINDQNHFSAGSAIAAFRTSKEAVGFVGTGTVRVDAVTKSAPLAIWAGAGEGRARPGLLRAHRLLHDGVIDAGVFGRRVTAANLELQRWFDRPTLVRAGAAVFVDLARATNRLTANSQPFEVDAGLGLRMRVPGTESAVRLDYARGLRDGANRVTVGWIAPSFLRSARCSCPTDR